MTQVSVYGTKNTVPASVQRGTIPPIGTLPVQVTAPQQVMGLVPLYACCNEPPTATIHWNIPNTGIATFNFNLYINSTLIGSVAVIGNDSAGAISTNVGSILPAGFTCTTVINTSAGINYVVVTIYAPTTAYSGVTCSITRISGTDAYGATNFINTTSGDCNCRRDGYAADSVPDDTQWTIPAIASTSSTDLYKNDKNTWLLKYPSSYNAITQQDFHLQQYSSGHWSNIATLNSTTYGTPIQNNVSPKGTACINFNYCGYQLDWRKVLIAFGEGTYRFAVGGSVTDKYPYCLASPPFCLKEYSCDAADGTVRFEAYYSGGNMGSVTQQGSSWSLCCRYVGSKATNILSSAYQWYDSIRFYGFFGYTAYEFQREQIKYQTGMINKVRDEAIKKFTLKIGGGGSARNAPQWLLDRFAAYALQSDKLLVSDYNMNNAQYNFNRFWVVADSGFDPKYTTSSRYMKVLSTQFKEGTQYIYRDRCC